jgi:hypothetical protein
MFLENNFKEETGGISGFTVTNINYTLLPGNPSKVSSIALYVVPTDGACDAADARINIDNSATWITCTCPESDKWVCSFPPLKEPDISSISAMRLVTKTSVPWCKQLVFSILQFFNK